MLIPPNGTVLFQGDSITDSGRDRASADDLGVNGYALMVAAWYSALYPEAGVRFLNRGISGNRIKDLKARWWADCLDLTPAVLSLLAGVNDMWRRYDSNDETPVEVFASDYRAILTAAQEQVNPRLILMEPFLLPVRSEMAGWRADLDPKIEVVRQLAREFQAVLLPLDDLFRQACKQRPPAHWAADGVHPTPAGHALIAQTWLKAAGAL